MRPDRWLGQRHARGGWPLHQLRRRPAAGQPDQFDPQFVGTGADDTGIFWAVEVGIEKKWHELGKTTFFAQYYDHDGGANNRRTIADTDPVNPFAADPGAGAERIFATGVEMMGVGVVQEISAASMLLYTYYPPLRGRPDGYAGHLWPRRDR